MLSFLKKSRGLALETRNSFLKLRVSKYHSEECLPNTFFMILRFLPPGSTNTDTVFPSDVIIDRRLLLKFGQNQIVFPMIPKFLCFKEPFLNFDGMVT